MATNPIRRVAQNNADVAKNFTPKLTLANLRSTPSSVVISCVDPRADPKDFWALAPHGLPGVVRNAGGRAVDALRTLEGLDALGSGLQSVAVVHHTECGIGPQGIDDAYIKARLREKKEGDEEAMERLGAREFGSFKHQSVEESVKEDMRVILADPLLPKDLVVMGYVLDDQTGVTTEVKL